jgi:hypothetical protein
LKRKNSISQSFAKALFFSLILGINSGISAEDLKDGSSGFIENKGQILDQNYIPNNDVLFMFCSKGLKVQLRKTGYSYELFNTNDLPDPDRKFSNQPSDFLRSNIQSSRIDIDFLGMKNSPQIIAEEKSTGFLNYIINGKEVYDIHSYKKIIYKDVFERTDIEFLIQNSSFKYNIILHPGANIDELKFLCKGANSISNENGILNFETLLGKITESIPFSYYSDSPSKNEKVNYKISNNIITFSSYHNTSKTFIIDPTTNRIWATYYGDNSSDYCNATSTDPLNNVYMAGYTSSTSNIATSGVFQSTLNAGLDIYLAKFNTNGVRLWGTYFGGSSYDIAYGIHVTPYGAIYVCGDTNSPGIASSGAHQTVYGGGIDDALLIRFNTNGQLTWATYYGGLQHDFAPAVTTDASKNVILGGHTESNNGIATASAFNTTFGLNSDAFVAKFDSTGARQWGTYYGDTGFEEVWGAACDNSGNVYVTGFSSSLFGISGGTSHQSVNGGGGQDAFIGKFDPTGTNLIWGTYYGGTGMEQGNSIKIDNSGNVFVAGNTTSPNNIASTGAYQIAIGSADDGFITRFNTSGVRQWGTYFGGNDVDYIYDLILDPAKNNFFFCGSTESTNAISTANAYQNNLASINFYDAYFAKFSYSGNRLLGTYFGGTDNDAAKGITIDTQDQIYICGTTTSTNLATSAGSHMPSAGGMDDAFLAKFCVASEPIITPAATATICVNTIYTLSTQAGVPSYSWNNGATTNTTSISTSIAGTYYYAVSQFYAGGCDATSDSVKIVVDLCLGLDEIETAKSVKIFPIPAKDILNFEFQNSEKEIIFIDIYTVQGQLISTSAVADKTTEQTYTLDIENLNTGMYFVRIKQGNSINDKKIVIQK